MYNFNRIFKVKIIYFLVCYHFTGCKFMIYILKVRKMVNEILGMEKKLLF